MSENQDSYSEEDVRDKDRLVEELAADPEKKWALLRKLRVEETDSISTPSGMEGDASRERQTLSGMHGASSTFWPQPHSHISTLFSFPPYWCPPLQGIPPFSSQQ